MDFDISHANIWFKDFEKINLDNKNKNLRENVLILKDLDFGI